MGEDNASNKTAYFWREVSSDLDFEYSANSKSKGDSSVESSPFRGFEKQPKVLIEKFNIEPFLNRLNSKLKKVKLQNGISKKLPQLVSSCLVKVAREDLHQLQKDVLENSRLNKIKSNGILSMPCLHCKICEKAYKSEKKLQNHLENKHMLVYKAGFTKKSHKRVSFSDHVIVHELKEYHRCRKCTKIFEEYQYLKTHMKQEHRKRKCYICNYCSKNFMDRMFFKVHIKLHCDVCGLLFPNKRKYLIHRRDSCRIIKKYTCKTCENMFFSYMDLKDHSYDHLEDLFICDICKAQHSSKCAVSHHILFLHSNNRPKELYMNRNLGNERLYLCNFCEVSSIDRDMIDLHVSVLPDLNNIKRTGYKDYYFCDQCLKKFDTETNMLQHKWSHFLITSENLQVPSDKRVRRSTPAKRRREIVRIYKIHEKLPKLMQPKIVLERLNLNSTDNRVTNNLNIEPIDKNEQQRKENSIDVYVKKITADPESIKEVDQFSSVQKQTVNFKSQEQGDLSTKNGIINLTSQGELDSTVNKGIVFNPTLQMNGDPTIKEGIVNLPSQEKVNSTVNEEIVDLTCPQEVNVIVKKAIVDPKSKKTLISRFQCEKCHKYYSSNYCLNRHMMSVHQDYSNQCNVCEENFVWPSLLKSHNCIRMNIPEMPFNDARPEIQFDNYRDFGQAGIDELMNISESEDYMHSVDFEIPAPIVQLAEYESRVVNPNASRINQNINYGVPVHTSYKIVMQEVPIEF